MKERQDLIFRVFISSTFSDMIAERNALQEKVFPKLREYCQQKGARFQAIDLRWGVGEEAALDQQTMNICIQELRRCQHLSPRPNFIVLLGDRYGWRPLPPQINASEFESLLIQMNDDEKRKLLQWYRRDSNAVPPEYCLLPRNREFTDYNRWMEEEFELRKILHKAVGQAFNTDDSQYSKYFDSATHQEIQHGALQVENPQDHVFCYFREIKDLPSDNSANQYCDIRNGIIDTEAQTHLKLMKQELKMLLPPEHVHSYSAAWRDNKPVWQIEQICEDMLCDLKQVIDEEVDSFVQRPDLDREIYAHIEFGKERCRHFIGRQDILQHIHEYLLSDEKAPLIIHGKAGSGKTSVMAKAVQETEHGGIIAPGQRTKIVARYIGATPPSCDLRLLLVNLCRQLDIAEIPQDMNELVRTFRDRLAPKEQSVGMEPQEPVVLFLDALDQLNPTDNARMLYWLPRELAPNVKLVISVLQTERNERDQQNGQDDCFDTACRIWPGREIELGPFDETSASALLESWLAEAGRTLQPFQRIHLLERFKSCPLPLYLKLAFEESRVWKSWTELPSWPSRAAGLSDSVEGILDDLLSRLEQPRNHGDVMVNRALGYIAAGKNGLTEDELIDVLSADPTVMQNFYDRSPNSPKADRLPIVVWSRLLVDIERYMTRRRADGTIVLDFYHRQVREAVQRRYLSGEARLKAHQHLAEYFHKLDYWAESLEAQRARAKRLPPTPRPANVRKVVELPYHRLEAAKLGGKDDPKSPYWDAMADLLTDWQFLEAKSEADPNFQEQVSKMIVDEKEEAKV
jgi:hypothetical protein